LVDQDAQHAYMTVWVDIVEGKSNILYCRWIAGCIKVRLVCLGSWCMLL